MKVAIVHDYLTQYGGAERVLECFMDLFPDAPVYTLICDKTKIPARLQNADVRTSFLQKIPGARHHYKKMLSLLPLAIENLDLGNYDLILSTSSAFAKGIITNPNQLHICYCHTPMRYVWDLYHDYLKEIGTNPIYRYVLPFVLHRLRLWDQLSSTRVDHYIANSNNVANRIQKYYRRASEVIHPPVNFSQFTISDKQEDYYLIVSRLLPYKRVDIVIESMNLSRQPLIIIGDGYDRQRLEKLAGPTVTFLGARSDEEIADYYSRCKAFIMPGNEDFGITPLEAQASGRPVIAFGKGGALETVKEGVTGTFFSEQTASSLSQAVEKLDTMSFDPVEIRRHAESFADYRFKQKIHEYVRGHYEAFIKGESYEFTSKRS
ncbi:glycosyltransferase family 4 protein [Paenibacillus antri]|uniref:Glycosyltransferase family 4 protein n=1 Tax=Paenibacillus antri TaxID=2582848 RepID=A0A5R9GD48_9BACL|nr:glycosyltransferase [Paenibacillus antri]TLS52010.1 glycosyltransferase family 4 protein [Paenibacillus antri]